MGIEIIIIIIIIVVVIIILIVLSSNKIILPCRTCWVVSLSSWHGAPSRYGR